MREEMENKLKTILREIKSNKSASTVTNPRSETNELLDMRPSESNLNKSVGVHASNIENSDSEDEDYPLKASKMKDLKHPAKPFYPNESDVNVTIHTDEETDDEDYHTNQKWALLKLNWDLYNITFWTSKRKWWGKVSNNRKLEKKDREAIANSTTTEKKNITHFLKSF